MPSVDQAGAIAAALGAAFAFASAAVLQQEAASDLPRNESLHPRLLLDLLRRPRWLGGIALLISGYGLQALGLSLGPVALVQPIVVTELAFAIPFAMWRHHRRAGARELAGIALVLAGIATFLAVAAPTAGTANPSSAAWISSLVPAAGVVIVAVAVGSRLRGRPRPVILAVGAGTAFGIISVLTKSLTDLLSTDVGGTFTKWQPYAVVAVGVLALLVSQSAYQAGPLALSMPIIGVLEPVTAVVIGDTALNEQVAVTPSLLAFQSIAAAAAVAGILLLTTSPMVQGVFVEEQRENPSINQG